LRFKLFYIFRYVFMHPDIKNVLRRVFVRLNYISIIAYTI